MNQNPGIELVRRLDEAEQRLLQASYEACRTRIPAGIRELHWLNVYQDHACSVPFAEQARLHEWVTGLVAENYADWAEVHLLSYGFIVNPRGSTRTQAFHCDYGATSSNLLVPLTRVSLFNATQFLRQPLRRARMDQHNVIGHAEDILEAEGLDALEVTQLVCRSYCLLRLLPNTPHAGVANRDDYDRPMFYVTVDDHDYPVDEPVVFEFHDESSAPGSPPG